MPITRRAVKGTDLTWAELDANWDALDLLAPVVLTIASGAVTVTGPKTYRVAPEGGIADNLTAINGGLGHEEEITLRLSADGPAVTVKHTPPNLNLVNGADFILNSPNDTFKLQSRTPSVWTETGRNSVP
jgi:hypothetical protein